jgi:hypothetical protein
VVCHITALWRLWPSMTFSPACCRAARKYEALRLIGHAEDVLAEENEYASPDWFTWFSAIRLAAFKGNTQLNAGHLPQARETFVNVLETMPD